MEMHSSILVVLASLFIVSLCEDTTTENLLESAKKALPDAVELAKNTLSNHVGNNLLDKIPTSLDDISLPAGVNTSLLPSVEEGEDLIRKKCLKNGKNDSFDIAMQAKEDLQYCIKDIANFDSIQSEIEKYKPTGDLDIVFKKYCKKMPTMKECVNNFTAAIEPCLDEDEKISKKLIVNITESLDKFICYKEGDRIALFIAEGGPECLNDKQEAIQHCLNSTFSKHMPSNVPDMNNLPSFTLDEKQCRDMNTLQLCVVDVLEKCNEPTPANIVDSLFNFIRQSTVCAPYKLEQVSSAPNLFSSANLSVLLVSLVSAVVGNCLLYKL